MQALPPQLHWVLAAAQKGIKTREPAVQETVRKLRLEFPEATPDEVARTLIRRQRRRLAATAAASGAVSVVPGLGTLAVLGVGTVQSVYALEQELELVLAVGLIFGHLPVEHEDRTLEALLVVGLAGGAVKLRDDLLIVGSQRLAVHAVTTYPRLLLSRVGSQALTRILSGAVGSQVGSVLGRALPLAVGIGVGAGFDWITVTALGNAALRYYGPEGPAAKRAPDTE
ncbi:MAG: hypothetical protein ACRDL8_03730 [Solirubrobacteraceae bacterium]